MTLVNPKPLGYAYGELLPSADVNSVWSQLTHAVDGAGGGSYTLSNPLSIDGDTVTIDDLEAATANVTGAATVDTLTVTSSVAGDLTLDDDLTVTGSSTFDDVGVGGNLAAVDVFADNVNVATLATLASLLVSGTSTLGVTVFRFAEGEGFNSDDNVSGTVVRAYTGSGSHKTTLDVSAPDGAFWMGKNESSGARDVYIGVTLTATMSSGTGFAIACKIDGTWRVFYNT